MFVASWDTWFVSSSVAWSCLSFGLASLLLAVVEKNRSDTSPVSSKVDSDFGE
jgi:hypothetical protein